jgi:hypothetical protein
MNTDEAEIPFGGHPDARQRKKHLVIIGVYPRSSAPDSPAIPFRFSLLVNSYVPLLWPLSRQPRPAPDQAELPQRLGFDGVEWQVRRVPNDQRGKGFRVWRPRWHDEENLRDGID